jgi:transcriptional regulator with XRE-family HTH domain
MARPRFRALVRRQVKGKVQEHSLRRILRQNIRNRRLALGISQIMLGERVGVTKNWIQQLESPSGDEVPNLYALHDIATELGTTAADMLTAGKFHGVADVDGDLRQHLALTRGRDE